MSLNVPWEFEYDDANTGLVLLHFRAVDDRASVWVNGRLVGQHEGGSVPFRFDVTEHWKAGANVVTVRAEASPTDRYQPRGAVADRE